MHIMELALGRAGTHSKRPVAKALALAAGLLSVLGWFLPAPLCGQTSYPFSAHEVLEYQVKWDPPIWMFFMPQINAGRIVFNVLDQKLEQGLVIHKFKGTAISTTSLVKVNDRIESSSSGENFCASHVFEESHEGKRHREVEVTIEAESRSAVVVEKDIAQNPAKIIKSETVKDFPPCATDLVSGLYRARTLPLRLGESYKILLTDRGRTKEITLKPLAREYVNNEAGFFRTQKVEVFSFFGGLVRQKGTFYVWFTDDARHLPVKFDMKVKLGRVYGNLVKFQE